MLFGELLLTILTKIRFTYRNLKDLWSPHFCDSQRPFSFTYLIKESLPAASRPLQLLLTLALSILNIRHDMRRNGGNDVAVVAACGVRRVGLHGVRHVGLPVLYVLRPVRLVLCVLPLVLSYMYLLIMKTCLLPLDRDIISYYTAWKMSQKSEIAPTNSLFDRKSLN